MQTMNERIESFGASQTSRAGGMLTVLQADSPLLFWLFSAFKVTAVIFAYYMIYKGSKDSPLD